MSTLGPNSSLAAFCALCCDGRRCSTLVGFKTHGLMCAASLRYPAVALAVSTHDPLIRHVQSDRLKQPWHRPLPARHSCSLWPAKHVSIRAMWMLSDCVAERRALWVVLAMMLRQHAEAERREKMDHDSAATTSAILL